MRHKLQLLSLIGGLVLIAAAIKASIQPLARHVIAKSETLQFDERRNFNHHSTMHRRESIFVELELKHPEVVTLGESFLVHAKPEITKIEISDQFRHDEDAIVHELNGDEKSRRARELLESGKLTFELDLPGPEFKSQKVVRTEAVTWAIRPKDTGIHVGIISATSSFGTPRATADASAATSKLHHRIVWFDASSDSPLVTLAFDVREPRSWLQALWTGFCYAAGSLLTVPGFFAFSRQFADWRKQKGKKDRSRIILP